MKKLTFAALLIGLFVACGGEDKKVMVVTVDAPMQCNPLLNTGCPANQKCTWLLDATTPNYVGHIGCAPNGTVGVGQTCTYGPPGELGYDNCAFGGVCTNFRNPMTNPTGVCKAICDQQGGMPACDAAHTCVIYSNLFDLGETTPAAAGVCNVSCDPLADNDYDGSAADLTRPGTTCGSAAEGCYGSPSYGTPPISGWSCTRDINYGSASFYGHRTQCIEANGCADPGPKVFQNSCNQGYLPLLIEATGSTTTICVAFCEPANCFMGNCGTNNDDRQGKTRSPAGPNHRCNATDRIGTFDAGNATDGGEHCQFLWRREIDSATATYLPSPTSDKIGFCYDHSKYQYDSNGDNMPDMNLPSCATLQDGFGSGSDASMPTTYFGAADLGCVDSMRLMATGKSKLPESAMRKAAKIDMPRPLFDRRMYESE